MTRFRLTLGLMALLSFSGCGGRAEDTTILAPPAAEVVEPTRSVALETLAEPAVRDAFCGWVGASAAGVAGGAVAGLDCARLVERCREVASNTEPAAPANAALGLFGIADALEGALGCPVSFESMDACLAELIEWTASRYPDGPGCGMATPIEPPGLQDLAALPSCLVVAVNCPELLQRLLAAQ
ncbi:MAG: hypothetical protein ABI895_00175 [Deltaproteobacteria bacterium]